MECPACDNEAHIPMHAQNYTDRYGRACVVKMNCCGKMVRVNPVRVYRLSKAPNVVEDDWGETA